MRERISRRTFIQYGAAGLGAAVSLQGDGRHPSWRPVISPERGTAPQPVVETAVESVDATEQTLALARLIAPIAVGTRLGSTSVAAVRVDNRHLGVVTLTDRHGRNWDAEVARRTDDDETLNPLAVSKYFSLYLRNGGEGRQPTDDGVGRAVLSIGHAVRSNEDAAPGPRLTSRAEVWAASGYRRKA